MKKAELIKSISQRLSTSIPNAATILEETIGAIKQGIEEDGEVILRGFGSFKKETRPARTGRNPNTGESIQIAEKQVVKFKPSKA